MIYFSVKVKVFKDPCRLNASKGIYDFPYIDVFIQCCWKEIQRTHCWLGATSQLHIHIQNRGHTEQRPTIQSTLLTKHNCLIKVYTWILIKVYMHKVYACILHLVCFKRFKRPGLSHSSSEKCTIEKWFSVKGAGECWMWSFSALHVSLILNCLFMKVDLPVCENSRVALQLCTETLGGSVTKARHHIVCSPLTRSQRSLLHHFKEW